MPEIRTHSHKPKLAHDSSYPLAASDLEAALKPHLSADIHLSLSFSTHQAWRKEDRDRVGALGEFRLLECRFDRAGSHLGGVPGIQTPWAAEEEPKVVVATVYAVPTSALTKGVGLREPLGELLAQGLKELAGSGLPSTKSRADAWLLELKLDSRVHAVQAQLKRLEGRGYVLLKTLNRPLPPVGVSRRV